MIVVIGKLRVFVITFGFLCRARISILIKIIPSTDFLSMDYAHAHYP